MSSDGALEPAKITTGRIRPFLSKITMGQFRPFLCALDPASRTGRYPGAQPDWRVRNQLVGAAMDPDARVVSGPLAAQPGPVVRAARAGAAPRDRQPKGDRYGSGLDPDSLQRDYRTQTDSDRPMAQGGQGDGVEGCDRSPVDGRRTAAGGGGELRQGGCRAVSRAGRRFDHLLRLPRFLQSMQTHRGRLLPVGRAVRPRSVSAVQAAWYGARAIRGDARQERPDPMHARRRQRIRTGS